MSKRPIMTVTHHGDFNKTEKFFEKLKNKFNVGTLDKYGKKGVRYLSMSTPKDTGLTASSWYYEVKHDDKGMTIVWSNSNINDGVNIAMILQYGHGTNHGGWVEGIDYINPALKKIFDEMAKDAAKEVFGIL